MCMLRAKAKSKIDLAPNPAGKLGKLLEIFLPLEL